MAESMKIALAQINPTVGDIDGNLDLIRAAREEAVGLGAELVIFGEMCVSGYPAEDLSLSPMFLDRVRAGVEALAVETADGGPGLIVGGPALGGAAGGEGHLRHQVQNTAFLLDAGEVKAQRGKRDLPNYGVFDEKRIFKAGDLLGPVNFRGVRLGLMVCEDMWTPEVAECMQESGAELLVVINGSPYESDKVDVRLQVAVTRVVETGLPLIYVNQIGGQDELVFDGASFVLAADCSLTSQLPAFRTDLALSVWQRDAGGGWLPQQGVCVPPLQRWHAIYEALVLGLRDYVDKNRFPGVILGLSGGIDSALSAAVAVDSLGPERVHCVMMPSPYTSRESLEDAAEASRLLGVRFDEVSIEPAMEAFATMLAPLFAGTATDVTEENIQARARGLTLMAISNKRGAMVLSTGNKSEMSVGYATLYGDMCGGFNVLKDVYKTTVFELARWRNQTRPPGCLGPAGRVVPERTISKPPSAELRPDQVDEDSLPPYDVLDRILEHLIERDDGVDEIVTLGYERNLVNRIWRLLELAEYKRRQAAPGIKITRRDLSRDRRYPITNAFKGPL